MAPPAPQYKVNKNGIPAYEDLPLGKGDPHHSAWGLYGEGDELGTLNRLTGERVVAAAKGEVRDGMRCVLSSFLVLGVFLFYFVGFESFVLRLPVFCCDMVMKRSSSERRGSKSSKVGRTVRQ